MLAKEFYTTINCMDGRVQLPVINFLREKFGVEYIDSITEPGPILILAENKNKEIVDSILKRVDISINKHHSRGIAIVGHYDCAGNPVSKDIQINQLKKSKEVVSKHFPQTPIILLWVNENWGVEEIPS